MGEEETEEEEMQEEEKRVDPSESARGRSRARGANCKSWSESAPAINFSRDWMRNGPSVCRIDVRIIAASVRSSGKGNF